MLVLTRKVGERIAIGEEIFVTILDVKGRQVKLGIQAPPHTQVHREEVYVRILEENRAAAMAQKEDLEGLDKLILVDPRGSGKRG